MVAEAGFNSPWSGSCSSLREQPLKDTRAARLVTAGRRSKALVLSHSVTMNSTRVEKGYV